MNVYDFDKTIYSGDSTVDFYLYCLLKKPGLIRFFPTQVKGFLKYKLGHVEKKVFKEMFFSFLQGIDDISSMVNSFWDKNQKKIKVWYSEQQDADDVIISASPRFLLEEICVRQKISCLIASEVDARTGKFNSENCYGEEKVKRFRTLFQDSQIDRFYSDSKSDEPMAKISKEAFIVKGNEIKSW